MYRIHVYLYWCISIQVCVHKPWLKGGDSDGDTRDVGGFVCQFGMSFAAVVAFVAIVFAFLFG